ncbi:Intraflagellar transport protein 56 [Physocladia obscura]|uniref:Intraflagellar transport protein 56 n=1 Tax=Physocladia obscura TaxID=109957 RepID=A0AAD5SV42_9FUNG|nr:Intraflagellar transport protein 56 [Physocladia obscura]
MCYYKLDYYDVSQEVLAVYLQHFPDSLIAINLKACNHFRLYNGKAAEAELNTISEKISSAFRFADDLIKHNMVVFRGGEGALQVFPNLLDVIPEARLNLVIFHMKNDDIISAFNLMKDVEPSTPQEYILKGIVNAALGQDQESRDHLKIAQQYFQLVGGSASECDTIPGRQCMASCFFLLKQFDDVLIYLNSIKSFYLTDVNDSVIPIVNQGYFYNDDTFNYNYGQAKVAAAAYEEAEDILLMIQSDKLKNEYAYLSHLAKCYIMNKKPRLAWELYLKMETSSESFSLLQLVANDCYKMSQYLYSAKAFDVLERLDPNPDYWEGKRGACIGILQQIISGDESKDCFRDIITLLRNTSNPQVEYIVRIIKKKKNMSDLEADFLARERELLGDDALQFGNPLVGASADAGAGGSASNGNGTGFGGFGGYDTSFANGNGTNGTTTAGDGFGEFGDYGTPGVSKTSGFDYDFDAGLNSSAAVMAALPQFVNNSPDFALPPQEPEAVRLWRENFELSIADRDARSVAKNGETVNAAKDSLDRFYAEYNDKKNKTIARNKEFEKDAADHDETLNGTIWERVVKQIDTSAATSSANNAKLKDKLKLADGKEDKSKKVTAPKSKDTGRMKSLLINLKSDKNAPGANDQ